jgi:hypothetical protein
MIDPAVVLSTEHQARVGLACSVDAGPAVVRISLQIREILVDGVGMDIDEATAGESVSVDSPPSSWSDGWVPSKSS